MINTAGKGPKSSFFAKWFMLGLFNLAISRTITIQYPGSGLWKIHLILVVCITSQGTPREKVLSHWKCQFKPINTQVARISDWLTHFVILVNASARPTSFICASRLTFFGWKKRIFSWSLSSLGPYLGLNMKNLDKVGGVYAEAPAELDMMPRRPE